MKRVLIVRLDAIGDYILWRNCLRFICRSVKYRDAHLTVFGNPAWQSLAEAFDADCADEWIWVENRGALFRRPVENLLPYCVWHRRVAREQSRLRERLLAIGFDEVISPCAFHDPLLDELVRGIIPRTSTGAAGQESAVSHPAQVDERCSEGARRDTSHVFLRNRAITASLCGEPCDVPLRLDIPDPPVKTPRVMFFTGASHWTRRWPRRRWRALAGILPSGLEPFEAPQSLPLPDFARLMASCAAVVTNDTMALHMAAALGVPVVGIVNGVSGRDGFWPYPRDAHGGAPCASTICAGPVAIVGAEVRNVHSGTPCTSTVCAKATAPVEVRGVAPRTLLAKQLAQYRNLAAIAPETVLAALREVLP